jgi:hypothetical protein
MDRRRHVRFGLKAPLSLVCKEDHHGECDGNGYTRDVSECGLFVVTDAQVPLNAKIHIEIEFTTVVTHSPLVMTADGRIVRIESKPGEAAGFAVETNYLDFRNVIERGKVRALKQLPLVL